MPHAATFNTIFYMEEDSHRLSNSPENNEGNLELSPEELVARLRNVLSPEHIDYLLESVEQGDDIQDMIGYAYGALLDQGEDPDEVLVELGIIQPEDS